LLDGEIRWFCSFQDLIDKDSGTAPVVKWITPVTHEATLLCPDRLLAHCGQPVFDRKLRNLSSVKIREATLDNDKSTSFLFLHRSKGSLKFICSSDRDKLNLDSKRRGDNPRLFRA
jgi:hypothetical protein